MKDLLIVSIVAALFTAFTACAGLEKLEAPERCEVSMKKEKIVVDAGPVQVECDEVKSE